MKVDTLDGGSDRICMYVHMYRCIDVCMRVHTCVCECMHASV